MNMGKISKVNKSVKYAVILLVLLQIFCNHTPIIAHNATIGPMADSTLVQKTLTSWSDSLRNRNFSDDAYKLRKTAEELSDKTKNKIEKHTSTIKELIGSFVEYLTR